jgi:hypothetical protein
MNPVNRSIPLTPNKRPLEDCLDLLLTPEELEDVHPYVKTALERVEYTLQAAGYGRSDSATLISEVGGKVTGVGGKLIDCINYNINVHTPQVEVLLAVQVFPGREARPWFSVTVDEQEQADALGQVDPGMHLSVFTDEDG